MTKHGWWIALLVVAVAVWWLYKKGVPPQATA
jgi:hypothetical protein